jgi:hypothetical protein
MDRGTFNRLSGLSAQKPSNPFRSLAAQTRRVAISYALFTIWPDLEKSKGNPRGFMELGDGYLPLGPKDVSPHQLSPSEQTTLEDFVLDLRDLDQPSVYRYGRLGIPTGQIARSRWKEAPLF